MQKYNNVSKQEIEKFNNIANDWWNLKGEFKALHDINPLRINFIKENINLKNKQLLDVGCGGGILSEALYLEKANITGIDLSENAIKIAKEHAKLTGKDIKYKKISIEELASSKSQNFDIITCMELMEHVPNPQSIIDACANLLKKDGVLFLSTLNKNITSYFKAIIVAEYVLKLIPKKTHDFNKFITPANLYKMCLNSNLEIKKFSGFTYNFFKKKYYKYSNIKVNYLAYAQKL